MTETAHDIIRIEDLRISVDLKGMPLEVVRGASFRIPAGKTVALVGESGSGKSVIAQAIMGILPSVISITGGHIHFVEKRGDEPLDLAAISADSKLMRDIRGGRISIIFQEPMTSLSPLHTIGDQISEAFLLHIEGDRNAAKAATIDILKLVGFPDADRAFNMYPMELSGGLRQRAMIGMALICRPSLLIADEPTTALDVSMQAKILSLLKDLQARLQMAVLLITHDLGVVANMADEVVVIYHGQIMEAGTVEDIFWNPRHPYLKALHNAVPRLAMGLDEKLVSLRDIKHEIPAMMARSDTELNNSDPKPLLSVRNLSKAFTIKKQGFLFGGEKRSVTAVDNVSFDIRRGECFGLVGESGCGKTTTTKLIMRAMSADSGEIIYRGKHGDVDIRRLNGNALKKFRQCMQMVFQDPFSSLSPRATVLNILREPLEVHGIGDRRAQTRYAEELMRVVGLQPTFLNRYPHSFSGGQRQRIGIARALALRPELMICDEPVSALDVSVQAQVLNLLKQLQRELGLTYIFISHNLAVVRYVADRIAVMYGGRIVEIAPRDVLFDNPVHPYTKILLSVVPHADLDHPLDFQKLKSETVTEGRNWGYPFEMDVPDYDLELIDLGNDHAVLAAEGMAPDTFRANGN